jgi:phosphonate transport system substrate-binding protein
MKRLRLRLLPPLLTGFLLILGIAQADESAALHLGVFPRHPAQDTQQMFEPLRAHLSERLARPVVLHTPVDYPSFWSAIEEGRFDLVHYNQYHYVRAHAELGHRLIAANEEHGRRQIRALVHVRSDSEAQTLDDLRGRKILFGGGPSAMVSYILATDLLRSHGLEDGDYVEQFAQNPIKALVALYFMQADAASAGDPVIDLPSVREQIGTGGLRVLAQSQAIPHLPWAVSASLPHALETAVRDALLDLNTGREGRRILDAMQLSGLRAVEDRQYDVVRRIVARVLDERY